MMRRAQGNRRRFLLAMLVCSWGIAALANAADKRDIIKRARQSYYNLPAQGLVEFQSAVVPDWKAVLSQELKTDISPDHPALKVLQRIHFWWSLDQKGSAKLTHQTDVTPDNEKSREGLNQTISGVEEMLSGFAQTMGPFLFTSPFPEADAAYELEEQADQYRLSYKEAQYNVATTMRKDFAITEMKVAGPGFTATVKPQVTGTPKGFLVTGYQATYQSSAGGEAYLVSTQIEYKEVQGLQLPNELRIDATASGAAHKMNLQFTDVQVKKN